MLTKTDSESIEMRLKHIRARLVLYSNTLADTAVTCEILSSDEFIDKDEAERESILFDVQWMEDALNEIETAAVYLRTGLSCLKDHTKGQKP